MEINKVCVDTSTWRTKCRFVSTGRLGAQFNVLTTSSFRFGAQDKDLCRQVDIHYLQVELGAQDKTASRQINC